jgi:hypothetical protein
MLSIKSKLGKHICGWMILFSLILPVFSAASINSAQAADSGWWGVAKEGGLDKIGKTAFDETGEPDNIIIVVSRIIKVFLSLLGIIFVVLLVWAGFKWMTAGGDDEKVKEARDQIFVAIIGLLIVLASYTIAHFVLNKIIYTTTGSEPVW